MAIGNWYAKQAAMAVFKKTAEDFSTSGSAATSVTTYQTGVALAFTPLATSDFLIVATAPSAKSVTTSSFYLKLRDTTAGVDYGERMLQVRKANTHLMPWTTYAVVTNLSGAQTWEIQLKSVSAGTCFFNTGYIVAICLNSFPRYAYAESLSRDTTTSGTYQSKVTVTLTTPQAQPTLLFSTAITDVNSTTVSVLSQVTQDGVAIMNSVNESDSLGPGYPHGGIRVVTPTAGLDMAFINQYASEDGVVTAAMADAKLLALQTVDNVTVRIKGGSILGGSIK